MKYRKMGRFPFLKSILGVIAALWGAYFFSEQYSLRVHRHDEILHSFSSHGEAYGPPTPREWVPPLIPRYPLKEPGVPAGERDNAEYRMRRARSSALIW